MMLKESLQNVFSVECQIVITRWIVLSYRGERLCLSLGILQLLGLKLTGRTLRTVQAIPGHSRAKIPIHGNIKEREKTSYI